MKIIDEGVLVYFRNRGFCELCGRSSVPLQPHHLIRRGMGGGSRLDHPLNLVALCPPCHGKAHDNHDLDAALWRIVDLRNGLEFGQAEAAMRRLLRTPAEHYNLQMGLAREPNPPRQGGLTPRTA